MWRDTRRPLALATFPTRFLEFLLEKVVDFVFRQAGSLPAFPGRCQDLIERPRGPIGTRTGADVLFEELMHVFGQLPTAFPGETPEHPYLLREEVRW